MNPAVHVSIHDIIDISGLVDVQNTNIMLHIIFTRIDSFMSTKAKYFCQPVKRLIITPQVPLLHKTGNRS